MCAVRVLADDEILAWRWGGLVHHSCNTHTCYQEVLLRDRLLLVVIVSLTLISLNIIVTELFDPGRKGVQMKKKKRWKKGCLSIDS